jgi:hypothetical protein
MKKGILSVLVIFIAIWFVANLGAQINPTRSPAWGIGPGQPVEMKMRSVAYLGVQTREVSPEIHANTDLPEGIGVVVEFVEPDSPAAKAGISRLAILTKFADQLLINPQQLDSLVRLRRPGEEVELTVFSKGRTQKVRIVLGKTEMPEMVTDETMPWPGVAIGQAGQAVSGRGIVFPDRGVGSAQGGVSTQAAKSAAEKAIEKYIQAKGGPGLTGRAEEAGNADLKALFPNYTFVLLTIPQWPLARPVQAPLEMNNVFAVDNRESVTLMTSAEQLQKFFQDKLPALKGDDQLKAASAWATLTVEFYQDGMFRFTAGKPEVLPTGGQSTMVRVVMTVNQSGGNSGEVTSTLSIDPAGRLVSASNKSTLKAGMRPICQSTKLLDSDPLVRQMAEQDLLIMGRECFWYLDMMRAESSPQLQLAIDTIKERILRDERIDPR